MRNEYDQTEPDYGTQQQFDTPPYQCQIGKCTFAGFTSWACDNGTAVGIGGAQDTQQRSCGPQNAQDSVCGALG